jgi:predicted DsbA family dithiol-disulfide isomerase
MMSAVIRIDFVSDIACPWCAVGLFSLKHALASLPDNVQIDLHFQPFELNPNMPKEGENTAEHIAKKYGSTPEQSAAARKALTDRGAEVGFQFNFTPETRIWNTFDAHRLMHWAQAQGKAPALKEALLALTFTENQPSAAPATLREAARRAGLDPEGAEAVITSDRFTAEVRAAQRHWQQSGINAVPSVVFENQWLVQGGQAPAIFAQAMVNILNGSAKRA